MDLSANLPVDCAENIFCHLSGSELLKCTLVCPEWNKVIGSTRSCMRKIEFKCFCYQRDLIHAKACLLKSDRKYECLDLAGQYAEEIREFLFAKDRKWTKVTSTCLSLGTVSEFSDFLGIFQSSAETLLLPIFKITNAEKDSDYLFPALEFP